MSKSVRRFLSFLLVLQLIIPYSSFAAAVGEFSSVVGNVTQTRAKEVITPIVKSPIELKDLIVTTQASSAMMLFSDNSTIKLEQNSKLEIKEFLFKDKSRTGIFSLAVGKVTATVNKFIGGDNVFEVHSPTAVVGVRGTGFEYVEAVNAQSQGVATISCTEGSLNLSALSAIGKVISTAVLEAGQVAVITAGVITISAIGAAMAAGIAGSTKTGTAGAAGGAGTGTGGAAAGGGATTATAAGSGTTVAAGGAAAGAATAATVGTATAATGLSTTAIAAGIAVGGAAVVGGAVAAGGSGGGGSSSSGGGGTTGGGSTTTDYSRYSGTWNAIVTETGNSSDLQLEMGGNYNGPIGLTVTPAGAATTGSVSNQCGSVYSGSFVGNVLTMTSNNEKWVHNGVLCCTGTGTITVTFSDENHGTGFIRGNDCPGKSGWWSTSNITMTK